jgi:hypothetical protein
MDEVYSLNRQVKKKAMSSLAMEFFIKCCFVDFQLKIIMKSAEFMLLITAIDELDHHQRKLLSAALNRRSDELKALELIETCFEARNACPHCANLELYRHGLVNGLQRYTPVSQVCGK